MTIPREVILDLLPLYMAGEVSPATRQLVEEFLRNDAELADVVRRSPTLRAERPLLQDDVELRALKKTRAQLSLQRWLFGLAWAFTAVALAIRVETGRGLHVHLMLFENFPHSTLGIPALLAVVCWLLYFYVRKR